MPSARLGRVFTVIGGHKDVRLVEEHATNRRYLLYRGNKAVEVVPVPVECERVRADGSDGSTRTVVHYWSNNGDVLAVSDPLDGGLMVFDRAPEAGSS